jgi:hypothetical protein
MANIKRFISCSFRKADIGKFFYESDITFRPRKFKEILGPNERNVTNMWLRRHATVAALDPAGSNPTSPTWSARQTLQYQGDREKLPLSAGTMEA